MPEIVDLNPATSAGGGGGGWLNKLCIGGGAGAVTRVASSVGSRSRRIGISVSYMES